MKCKRKGCNVTLSMHNHDRLCWGHRQERQRSLFVRKIEDPYALTAEERRRYVRGEW